MNVKFAFIRIWQSAIHRFIFLFNIMCLCYSQVQASSKIVMVGDSQIMGYFGEALQQDLTQLFDVNEVDRWGVAGATLGHWLGIKAMTGLNKYSFISYTTPTQKFVWQPVPLDFPDLPILLRDQNIGMVVLVLGSNDVGNYCKQPDKYKQFLMPLKKVLNGRSCIWVGPPYFDVGTNAHKFCSNNKQDNEKVGLVRLQTMVDIIRDTAEAAGCHFFDSSILKPTSGNRLPQSHEQCYLGNTLMTPNDQERAHFQKPQAVIWSRCVSLEIASHRHLVTLNHSY